MKKNFMFFFYLISGIILGSLLAAVSKNVSWLTWLAFGTTIGFGANTPAVLDLSVLTVWFGFSFTLTVAHVVTIGSAMAIYHARRR
ncbi:MAG: DUF4321 domain-containing protein [Oscillospiraceae bacterium]